MLGNTEDVPSTMRFTRIVHNLTSVMILSSLRRLSDVLPRNLRVRLAMNALRLFFSAVFAFRETKPGPVTILGFLRSTLGLGQGARSFSVALRALGLEVRAADLGAKFRRSDLVEASFGEPPQSDEGGVLIVHLNPPELPMGLFHLGRKQLKHKSIVGYWTWELPTMPGSWRHGFDFVDEVWVPTTFVADAIRPHTQLPVRVVPYPVKSESASAFNRAAFNIPEDAFVCLTLCDVRSSAARKNPIGAIRTFRRALGDSERAVLLVKISNSNDAPAVMAEIDREIGSATNIRLILSTLSVADQAALIQCSDVIVSLHRAEGFGLVLAEAMVRGKVALATGWSGNMDFMNATNSVPIGYQLVPITDPQGIYDRELGPWAEPNLDEAARKLRELADDEELRRKLGAEAIRTMLEYFDEDRFRTVLSSSLVFHEGADGSYRVRLATAR